jgi:hypothetical protein
MRKRQTGKGIALVVVILMAVLMLPIHDRTQAGGGGILVNGTEICLNGVRFEATLVDVIAQNHPMETAVYTLNPYLEIAFGADHEFTYIGETRTFTIAYPSSTFEAGDTISIALQTLDGALAGGGGIYTVNDCIIPELDGRLNHDLAAPVVMYQDETVDVYAVGPDTSKGILVMRLSMETIEASGNLDATDGTSILVSVVNPATELPIIIYRLGTGDIQVVTYYANGKPYVFRWHPSQPYDGVHVEW